MIILSAKGFPTPAVLVLMLAAMSILEQRGGWWLITGTTILVAWVLVSALQAAFMSLHDRVAQISEDLDNMFVDMEEPDEPTPS